MRRRRLALLAALAVGLVVAPLPRDVASASCVGPMLDIGGQHRPTVTPGQQLTVTGSYFVAGCNDTRGVTTGGCSAQQAREPVRALKLVTLSIRQHGHEWTLATADADTTARRLGEVTWSVTLPAALQPGRAKLITDRSGPLRVVVAR